MIKFVSTLFILLFSVNSLCAQVDFSENKLMSSELFTKMDSTVKAGKYEHITSILIAKNGKLLFEKYYDGSDLNSKHNTRSATKTMATLLTGIAIDKGFIVSEKDKIFNYLKHKMPVENPDPRKSAMTIEDLLTMSSILECDDNNSFSRGNEERMYIIEDWAKFLVDLPVKSYPFGPKPEESPYGRTMSYCSAGAAAVAEIVQSAIGTKVDEYFKTYLLDPLDIKDYKLHYTPAGTLNTAGGSEYRSRDLLKLIQLCLQNGKWNGQQLISSYWIKKATNAKVNAWEGMDYGYLFWLRNFGKNTGVPSYAMAGNGGNKMVAFPDLNVTVVLTSTNFGNSKAHSYTDELLDKYIVPELLGID